MHNNHYHKSHVTVTLWHELEKENRKNELWPVTCVLNFWLYELRKIKHLHCDCDCDSGNECDCVSDFDSDCDCASDTNIDCDMCS